jgi:2-polyprenyl-3-methyl-5-hydroxy-6-metoxy-1,4-benzoquinol methylase
MYKIWRQGVGAARSEVPNAATKLKARAQRIQRHKWKIERQKQQLEKQKQQLEANNRQVAHLQKKLAEANSQLSRLIRRDMRNGSSSEEVNEEPTTGIRTTTINTPPEFAADHKRGSMFTYLLDNTIDGKTLLDLGAGSCIFSKRARAAGYEVTAVDARTERLPDDLDGIRFIQADVRNFDTSGYDVILLLGLLYHLTIADQEELLSRARGATVVVDTQVHDPRKVTEHAGEWAQRTVYTGSYEGIEFPEKDNPMASVGNPVSFWHTERSLLTLFGKCGYNQAMIVEPKYISKYGARGFYILS